MGSLISGGIASLDAYENADTQQAWTDAQHIVNDANTFAQNTVGQANVDAQNLVNQTYADATNAERTATNAVAAAQASLADTNRSIQNWTRETQLGNQSDSLNLNLARTAQAMVRGTIDQRLQASEQTGALRAQLAATGTGGGSSAALLSSLNIQQSRARQLLKDNQTSQTFDGLKQQLGVQANRLLTYDYGQTIANINTAQEVYSPQVWSNVISPIVAGDYAGSAWSQAARAFVGKSSAQDASAALSTMQSWFANSSTQSGGSFTNPKSSVYGGSWSPFSTGATNDFGSSTYDYAGANASYTGSSGYTPSATYGFEGSGNPFASGSAYSFTGSNSYGFTTD